MRPLTRLLVRILAALTAGVAVVLAVAAWIVASGPVSLTFLTPYFEEALAFPDSGMRVELGDTVLVWGGWERNIDLRAVGVRVVDRDGAAVAQFPEVSVTLSAAALVRGRIAPTRIEFLGPELRFVRNEDGRFAFGDVEGAGAGGGIVKSVLAALGRAPDPESAAAYLDRVAVAGAVVRLEDRTTGVTWEAPVVDANLSRSAGGVTGDLDVQLELDSRIVRLSVAAEYAAAAGTLTLGAAFRELNPAVLAGDFAALPWLRAVDAAVSGTASAVIAGDGTLSRIEFDLAVGEGRVTIPEAWADPQSFEQLAVRGSVYDGLRTIRVDESFAAAGEFTAQATASIVRTEDGLGFTVDAEWENVPADALAVRWPQRLTPRTRAWVTGRVGEGTITEGSLHMHLEPGRLRDLPLRSEEVDLRFAFTGVSARYLDGLPELRGAAGTARLTGANFNLSIEEGTVGGLQVSEGALHVDGLDTRSSRSMAIDVVGTGTVAEGVRVLGLPPLSLAGFPAGMGGAMATRAHLTFPVRAGLTAADVRFAAAANIRELSIADFLPGYSLSSGTLAVRADSGSVEAQGTVRVNGVPVGIEAHHSLQPGIATPTRLNITSILDGAAREALGLRDGGLVAGPVSAVVTVDSALSVIDRVAVDLELTSARLQPPIAAWAKPRGEPGTGHFVIEPTADGLWRVPSFSLESGALSASGDLLVDAGAGEAAGTALVNEIPVEITWSRGSVEDSGVARAVLTATLDDEQRAALGYPTGEWITGPVAVTAEFDIGPSATRAARVQLGLRDAAAAVPGWHKEPGMDGVAQFTVAAEPGGAMQMRSFAVSAEGLAASGSTELDAAGSLQRLQLARLVLGETNLSATVARSADGVLQILAEGARLDLRPLLDEFDRLRDAVGQAELGITGRFDQVILTGGRDVRNFEGIATRTAGAWREFDSLAALPDGSAVMLRVTASGDGYDVHATAADAGAAFGHFGFFHGASGGTATLEAKSAPGEEGRVLIGTVQVDEFRVQNAPALAQLLSVASLTGLGDLLQGSGMSFTGFEAPFTYKSGRVSLGRSRAWGPALGITVEGEFSRSDDSVNLAGTVVPAYTLNSVLGAIPILGDLIIGEGVFAIAYRATGPLGNPTMTVNPLSVITPGFLRGIIFGFGAGDRRDERADPVPAERGEPPPGN